MKTCRETHKQSVADFARDNWTFLLTAFGIPDKYLNGRHQDCFGCGGKDRFRFDDKDGRGTFYCNGGGNPVAGDGFALLNHVFGWDFRQSAKRIEDLLGNSRSSVERVPQTKQSAKVRSTSDYARKLWKLSTEHFDPHPYQIAKGIEWPAGARRGRVSGRVVGQNADCLVIPIRDLKTHEVVAIQAINPDGKKQTFGSLKDNGLLLGNALNKSIPWYVCEGWATGISLVFHHNNGNACCGVAFGQSNMEMLAHVIAEVYQPDVITIMEEQD